MHIQALDFGRSAFETYCSVSFCVFKFQASIFIIIGKMFVFVWYLFFGSSFTGVSTIASLFRGVVTIRGSVDVECQCAAWCPGRVLFGLMLNLKITVDYRCTCTRKTEREDQALHV